MAEPATPAPGAGTPAGDDPAHVTGVSEDSPSALRTRLDKLEKLNGTLFAEIRQLRKPAGDSPRPQPATDAEPDTQKARLEKLEKALATAQAEKAETSRRSAIRDAIATYGLDAKAQRLLESEIHFRHATAIKPIGDRLVHEDPETGEQTPISDFVGRLVKETGDMFKPAAAVPTGRGMRQGGTVTPKGFVPLSQMPPSERAKLTEAQKVELYLQGKALRGS
jgi:hypothetical protein